MLLYRGDCLDEMNNIPDGSVDLVLTDPPYGTTACKWDSVIPFEPMWCQLNRVTRMVATIVLFGSEPFSSILRISNIKEYKYDWKWDKVKPSGFQIAKHRPMQRTEDIMVFSPMKRKSLYFPIFTEREKPKKSKVYSQSDSNPIRYNDMTEREYTKRYPQSLLVFSNADQSNRLHPTQKPVALLEYLIRTYTNEGDTVLDFTMGSGSTGVACVNTGRKFIGIELDDNYYSIAYNRIKEAQHIVI